MATAADVVGLAKASSVAEVLAALPEQDVRIDASTSVATDIARVSGKPHIFFANFDGLVGGQNAVQTPQKGIRITVPAAGTDKAWFLPFLGDAVEIKGELQDGKLVFVLPEVQKGAIVWFD